jgi:hypothetical protein
MISSRNSLNESITSSRLSAAGAVVAKSCALGSELDGVAQKIREHLKDPVMVEAGQQ